MLIFSTGFCVYLQINQSNYLTFFQDFFAFTYPLILFCGSFAPLPSSPRKSCSFNVELTLSIPLFGFDRSLSLLKCCTCQPYSLQNYHLVIYTGGVPSPFRKVGSFFFVNLSHQHKPGEPECYVGKGKGE